MTDPPGYRDPEPPSARRWLRVIGIVTAIVLLAILVVLLVGGGDHGPARHVMAPFGSCERNHATCAVAARG